MFSYHRLELSIFVRSKGLSLGYGEKRCIIRLIKRHDPLIVSGQETCHAVRLASAVDGGHMFAPMN
jgi:hypothetical protein